MTKQNQEWNGEGLPPVGCECEFNRSLIQGFKEGEPISRWEDGDILKVLSIQRAESCEVAVLWNDRDRTALSLAAGCLRPIKPEPSERETLKQDILNNWNILGRDCPINERELAAYLHLLGYRKMGEVVSGFDFNFEWAELCRLNPRTTNYFDWIDKNFTITEKVK